MTDYPSEADLDKIKAWSHKDYEGLIKFIESIWYMPEFGLHRTQRRLYLSTAGWSGNEEIIHALRESRSLFWSVFWQSSRRGGHYVFKLSAKLLRLAMTNLQATRGAGPDRNISNCS